MYYYSRLGTIYTVQNDYTEPITNPIYNIIIKEAIELDIRTITMRDQTIRIIKSSVEIYFCEEIIVIYDHSRRFFNHGRIQIPYTEYFGLKDLIEKYT